MFEPPLTTTIYHPVDPEELALIEQSGFAAFPPYSLKSRTFYPVEYEIDAELIAHNIILKSSGAAFVTRFTVRTDFLTPYGEWIPGRAGGLLYEIPYADLFAFNAALVGPIEVIKEFTANDTQT